MVTEKYNRLYLYNYKIAQNNGMFHDLSSYIIQTCVFQSVLIVMQMKQSLPDVMEYEEFEANPMLK